MSVGKIIALLCGLLVVVAFIFLMSQNATPRTNLSKELNATADFNLSDIDFVESNLSFADELKSVKVLEKSLRKAPPNLSKLYLVNCAPCHFKDGKGEIAPKIAGKSKAYILEKLHAYKNNTIPNTLMHGLLINLKESDLEALASEISEFKSDE